MKFTYNFPAVKGLQANHEYYIAMIPMRLLIKLFSADDSDVVQPEYRSQRKINEARIPEIKQYILDNRNTYVFSALSASIDGDFHFISSELDENIGQLEIDMDAVFLINDGQHRKAAIEAAIQEDVSVGNETISIVFFKDDGLKRSQQMFADLNKHAVKASNSLATLYDSRDALAVATKNIIDSNEFFSKYTDKEKDILGKNSSNLFTLTNIYKANLRIIKSNECSKRDEAFILEYWNEVSKNIYEWNELLNKEITKKDLRENYIVTLAIIINAFGRLGSYFYENTTLDMKQVLSKLKNIDWLRSCKKNWENRTIRYDGKVMINEEAIILTCNKIKQLIGIKLNREEINKENNLTRRK